MRKRSLYQTILTGAPPTCMALLTCVALPTCMALLTACAVLFSACDKLKPLAPSPLNGNQVINTPSSSVRLFNFYGNELDVRVNNIDLTAFSTDNSAAGNQIGLSIFPGNVWAPGNDGSPVTLPATLLDKNQQMHLVIRPRATTIGYPGLTNLASLNVDTVLTNSPLTPYDFYAMANGTLRPIPRNSVSPSVSSNFKLRIINFQQSDDTLGLLGSVVLTYADGTPVSQLSPVLPGATSPYIELPYGSYQFKLYVAKAGGQPDYTKQLAELPIEPNMTNFPAATPQQLETVVRGYSPGGTYSLVVTPNIVGYDLCGCGGKNYFLINSYRVITEQAPPLNTSWARIEGVNALSASGVSLLVDGQAMGGNLNFGQSSDYTVVPQGTHLVEAVDAASGKVLASASYLLYPFDNITAWAYTQNGQPAIAFSNTDLTSTIYEAASPNVVDDGTDGENNIFHYPYVFQVRFLNLSDVPFVTFTDGGNTIQPYANIYNQLQSDTLAYPEAFTNLSAGIPDSINPFVVYPSNNPASGTFPPFITGRAGELGTIGASVSYQPFQSEPANPPYAAQVPGSLLQGIAPANSIGFASGTQIYTNSAPQVENGFFSVALVGSTADLSAPTGARMIIVKHNK